MSLLSGLWAGSAFAFGSLLFIDGVACMLQRPTTDKGAMGMLRRTFVAGLLWGLGLWLVLP